VEKIWTEIILTILGIIASIPVIIFLVKTNKSIAKIDVTANMPIVENDYRSEFTGGYTLGVVKAIRQNKNGTKLVEFYPIDIEQGENIKRPHLQAVVVKDEYFKPFSPGELSDRRNRIKLITKEMHKIPEKLRDSTEGKWATKEGSLGLMKSEITTITKNTMENMHDLSRDLHFGGLSAEAISRAKEEMKLRRDLINPNEEKGGGL